MKLSAGGTRWWWNPSTLAKSFKLNGGPFSISNHLGVPCVANTVFSLSIVDRKAVELVFTTSGGLVHIAPCLPGFSGY